MKLKLSTFVLAGLLMTSCALAQESTVPTRSPETDQDKETTKPAVEPLLAMLRKQGVEVDLEAKTVTIDAVVNRPADPLEYLLIHKRGKSHEALFVTEVKPSLLNSGLLLLGFEEGKNASYKPIDPPPTEEEVAKGADWVEIFPPEGMRMFITATWKPEAAEKGGEEGATPKETEEQTVLVEDLILDMSTRKTVLDSEWIFLGGRMAAMYRNEPEVFIADFEGNLVSICYLSPENHLATMKHENARDDQNWWISDLCPPPGTAVKVCFHRDMPKGLAERKK